MGLIGIIKDLLIVYITIRILIIFLFNLEPGFHVVSFVIVLLVLALIGILQRVHILPSHKG
ncbi:MAG: hypothetical protein KKG59_06255 [Nanoarchaeota archaeon]|nr:hypothetical protein [Nanoarchaeota archaeon]